MISKSTIWRRLKDENYIYGHYLLKTKLTEDQKLKRLIRYLLAAYYFLITYTHFLSLISACFTFKKNI